MYWAGKYNSINCAAGFHIREGRWLRHGSPLIENYIRFWLSGSGDAHSYSMWLASAVWEYCSVQKDYRFGIQHLPELIANFDEWVRTHRAPNGLFWSIDDRDAMEMSISGSGFRPTLNSYMYGDARAIARLAHLGGDQAAADRFTATAAQIKTAVQAKLWNPQTHFFQVLPAKIDEQTQALQGWTTEDVTAVPAAHNVREELGYIPWYFDLPDAGYETAFQYLMDPARFNGRWGVTTADRTHPRYRFAHSHECLWNGPVWPFATSQTLVAVAHLLRHYDQAVITPADYYQLLQTYAHSQQLTRTDGTVVPWIDEDQDPDTGDWIARTMLKRAGWLPEKGGYERGKDYNHSLFADLVITGLLGVDPEKPAAQWQPLIPDSWDYCLLEGVPLHGNVADIRFDRTGDHYHQGQGWQVTTR